MCPKSKAQYKRLVVDRSERLLENGIPRNCYSPDHSHEALSRHRWTWSTTAVFAHLSLILLYTLVTLLVLTKGFRNDRQRLRADNTDALYYCMFTNEAHYSSPCFVSILTKCIAPAREAMAVHSYTPPPPGLSTGPYMGNPSPKLDQAWRHLLRGTMTGISNSQNVVFCAAQCIAICTISLLVPY